jgi:hypothetical protein
MVVHVKNCPPYSVFQSKKFLYKIMFGDKLFIKYLYPFGAKYYIYISEENQIGVSKRYLRGIKYYVIGNIELTKIFQLYNC